MRLSLLLNVIFDVFEPGFEAKMKCSDPWGIRTPDCLAENQES